MPVRYFAGVVLILMATLSASGTGLAADEPRAPPEGNPQVVTLADGSTVRIFRGHGAPAPAAPQRAAPLPLNLPDQPMAVSGKRLWIVDPEQNVITACSVRRTSYVGERYIECLSSQPR